MGPTQKFEILFQTSKICYTWKIENIKLSGIRNLLN